MILRHVIDAVRDQCTVALTDRIVIVDDQLLLTVGDAGTLRIPEQFLLFGVEATVRTSFAFYNTVDDIDHLVDVVRPIQKRST